MWVKEDRRGDRKFVGGKKALAESKLDINLMKNDILEQRAVR